MLEVVTAASVLIRLVTSLVELIRSVILLLTTIRKGSKKKKR